MTEQDAKYLEPMRNLLGQDVLDSIEAAGWVCITAEDFDKANGAYVLQQIRAGNFTVVGE